MHRFALRTALRRAYRSVPQCLPEENMKAFEPAFLILTYLGFWKPYSWEDTRKGQLYDLARIVLIPLPFYLALGQIFHVVLETRTLNEMTETFFLMLSVVNVCCKVSNILLRRREVAELMDMLKDDCAMPKNDEETFIYDSFNDFIWYVLVVGGFMVEATMATGLALPKFQSKKEYAIPVETWTPYNRTSSSLVYWSTYVSNGICALSMGNLSIGTDVTLNGIMIAATAQIEMLAHRLTNLPDHAMKMDNNESRRQREQTLMNQSIRHHIFIYRFTDKFMETFSFSILCQWLVSSTAVSVSVYEFAMNTSSVLSLEFCLKLLYLLSVVLQLFLLCWFGEELALRSRALGSMILDANWTHLSPGTVKSLLMVSMRTTKPIIISSGYFVNFSLDTFKKILKVSYTAFNVLRDSSSHEH